MSALCGIITLVGEPIQADERRSIVRRMAQAAPHRGDQCLHHGNEQATFAQQGFATGSPAAFHQSWQIAHRDGVMIVAQARLDNREDLTARLSEDSHAPNAALILSAYQYWGIDCAVHLLGDFAFVVWDTHEQRVFAARDALGVKPLHYGKTDSELVFATEAQQVLQHPDIPADLDETTLGLYLCGMLDNPQRSCFRHVTPLPPAHRLIAHQGQVKVERYWDVDPEHCLVYRDAQEYAAHFKQVFDRAVSDRLQSVGNTVGIALSGGLDSSSVAAMARHCIGQQGMDTRIATGSFVFEQLSACDERPFIAEAATHLDLDTSYVEAERYCLLDDEQAFKGDGETPFQAWESGFQRLLQNLHGKGASVILTGHAGDDLLGGSPLVYSDRFRRGDWRAVQEVGTYARQQGQSLLPTLYRGFAAPLLPTAADRGLRRLCGKSQDAGVPPWIPQHFAQAQNLEEIIRQPQPKRFREAARQAIYDQLVGRSDHLRGTYWYDRHAARFGMEARHPFLDRRLVELILAFPAQQLFRVGDYKPLLRQAMAGLLPEKIRCRRDKAKLGSFIDFSLRKKAAKQVRRLLSAPLGSKLGMVDPGQLASLYRQYQGTHAQSASRALWYPLTLEIWLQQQYQPGHKGPMTLLDSTNSFLCRAA